MADAVPTGPPPRNDEIKEIRNQRLQYVFNPGRDHFPAKPYYEDGDPEMYTAENMDLRDMLHDNPQVQTAIRDFIDKHFALTGAKLCSKEKYVEVLIRVGIILRPGVKTEELAKLIREDFESDT